MQKSENCPFCDGPGEYLITHFNLEQDKPILDALRDYKEDWDTTDGVCARCLSNAHELLQDKLLNTETSDGDGFGVLPTPLRLNAHPSFTGNGVTICFIDSGFYPHPDIEKRILLIRDITQPKRGKHYFFEPHENAWHGTMTSVVCAGDGQSSQGVYRGIASGASLVLLKVTDENGHISGAAITKALQWVVQNHKSYGIKIVNLSVTDDEERSFHKSEMAEAVHSLTKKEITVVAAVGNDRSAPILPPANIPEVLTIGGFDDRNTLDPLQQTLYHSTSGSTVDGLLKPEIIAPAIWLAAPILPKSAVQEEAIGLFEKFQRTNGRIKADYLEQIKAKKLISPYYQHSDGTSFAAPIVCAVIAQMLEANPKLTPSMIREILLTTARPLVHENNIRQGYGVVQAGHAVIRAKNENHFRWMNISPIVDVPNRQIHFYFHHHDAKTVALAGDFNAWSVNDLLMKKQKDGFWHVVFATPPEGVYVYKYVVDGSIWATDPLNFYRVDDGFGAFNSRFFVT